MNKQALLSLMCASTVALMAGCTGDSLQPTASKNAYTPAPVVDDDSGGGTGTGGTAARAISEFTAQQGTYCLQTSTTTDCHLFAPPVANYIAWYLQQYNMTLMVDYAGIVNAWVQANSTGSTTTTGTYSLGTQVSGQISEEPMSDGRVRVMIDLRTSRASAFMIEGTDLMYGRTVFGYRPPALTDGRRQPAMGEATFRMVFINTAPGMKIPDLVQLLKAPEPGQQFLQASFHFVGDGDFRNGTSTQRARIVVSQQGQILPGYPGMESATPPMGFADMQIQPI